MIYLVEALEGNHISIAAQCLQNSDFPASLCLFIHLRVQRYILSCSVAKNKQEIDWKALGFRQLIDDLETGTWQPIKSPIGIAKKETNHPHKNTADREGPRIAVYNNDHNQALKLTALEKVFDFFSNWHYKSKGK